MSKILVDKDALTKLISALGGAPHLVAELQATREPAVLFTDNPINQLAADLRAADEGPFKQLREVLGYIEAGEGTKVSIFQDDATSAWFVNVGFSFETQRSYYASSLTEAIRLAYEGEKS